MRYKSRGRKGPLAGDAGNSLPFGDGGTRGGNEVEEVYAQAEIISGDREPEVGDIVNLYSSEEDGVLVQGPRYRGRILDEFIAEVRDILQNGIFRSAEVSDIGEGHVVTIRIRILGD